MISSKPLRSVNSWCCYRSQIRIARCWLLVVDYQILGVSYWLLGVKKDSLVVIFATGIGQKFSMKGLVGYV